MRRGLIPPAKGYGFSYKVLELVLFSVVFFAFFFVFTVIRKEMSWYWRWQSAPIAAAC